MEKIDIGIVGGGINGLLIAYQASRSFPKAEIVLFEKENFFGEHASTRNSGVLHAGIYYPKNSLKRQFCIEGNRLWHQFAEELDVRINDCGKLLVASSENELLELNKYYYKAKENQVPGIHFAEDSMVEKILPYVNVEGALFSETTAVIDLSSTLKSLERVLFNKNIPLLLNDEVLKIEKLNNGNIKVVTDREELACKVLINTAGMFAVDLRNQLGLTDLKSYLVKGNYLKFSGEFFNQFLIYPIPQKDLIGLGVHTSFDFDGLIRFGPNTIEVDKCNYDMDENVKNEMLPAILKIFKGIDPDKLSIDFCGIRSKIKKRGELYEDFWIKGSKCSDGHGISGYIELCGIDSPGFTSAPAISNYVVDLIKVELQK